jgi:hypothetical protein
MAKANSLRPDVLTLIPRNECPVHDDERFLVAFLSNRFMALVFNEGNGVLRVSVNRTTVNEQAEWQDSLSWDELMEVKRQIGHADSYAVEVLPPDKDIVNVANMRHFWIMPVPVVGWTKENK